MNITVIGTGYVGLVTGTCLAEAGNHVMCIDIDVEKVAKMERGENPIYEPHLDVLFQRNVQNNQLQFSTELSKGVAFGDVIFLALPTPDNGNGGADLSYVLGVSSEISLMMNQYKVIVNKSTVPVGTAEKVRELMSEKTSIPFDVVSNPEFLKEGFAVDDFLKPERIIIGSSSQKAIDIMSALYKPFMRIDHRIIVMDEKSAELTKYAANSFLATKITFMNEIANFCEIVGADVDMVRRGIGTDSRIGKRFLFPGIGYGGSCFPKDVKALMNTGNEYEYDFSILKAVDAINQKQKIILIDKIKTHFKDQLKGLKIGVWGLSFKPETDDIREASSLDIINELLASGADIIAYDPVAMPNVQKKIGSQISYATNLYQAIENVDALIICTEWSVFRAPDFDKIKQLMKNPVIFDGRNLYQLEEMKHEKITYYSIGREKITSS